MQLRPYQQDALDQLYAWFREHDTGHPALILPTGSGKSVVIAALCRDAVETWGGRVLILSHVKEILVQDGRRLRGHWPNAPLGIYSAGLGWREIDERITLAGIQSVRSRAQEIGHQDLILVDECHLISHKDEGTYRQLIKELTEINPALRVVGLTATPWRLGHGAIDRGEALFSDLIKPIDIETLVYLGHLCPLRSKHTEVQIDVTGVHRRGGEWIESELQAAVDLDDQNHKIALEVVGRAEDRKAWLLFCTGVAHAYHMRDALRDEGILCETVVGSTPKVERDRILEAFRAGEIRAMTNANVLTTGFDYPDLDLIAFLRPTLSPTLYVQMAGRGMRPKSHTDHCLVLDFAGLVATHGPITDVVTREPGGGGGEAPVKVCDVCQELCNISAKVCQACGAPFPEPESEEKDYRLHNDDIMGHDSVQEMAVESWLWEEYTSRAGNRMVRVAYYGEELNAPVIAEYLCLLHEGYAKRKAMNALQEMARENGVDLSEQDSLGALCATMNDASPPVSIQYKRDGKFYRIVGKDWIPF